MSGHSKWSTIKHQKGAKDARRGKLFAKLIRAIEVSAREGGSNPDGNPTLADAGPEVEVLAEVDGKVVAVRQGNLLATAFHPELSGEVRLHRWLVDLIAERRTT